MTATTCSAGVAAKSTAPELARGFIAVLTRPAFKATSCKRLAT